MQLTDRIRQDGLDAVLDLEPGEAAQLPLTESPGSFDRPATSTWRAWKTARCAA